MPIFNEQRANSAPAPISNLYPLILEEPPGHKPLSSRTGYAVKSPLILPQSAKNVNPPPAV